MKNRSEILHRHASIMKDFYHHVNVVRNESLHDGQIKVLRALLLHRYEEIQCQWGRSGGKSSTIMAGAWLWAMLNDNNLIYIIAPERSHGKKIFWTSGRIQKFGPPQYVEEFRDSELILVFKNGSKICIDGSENYDALRGIKPNLVFYDEFQKHSREFDVEVMEPNRTAKNSSLVAMGTPPRRDCYYVEFRKNLLEAIHQGDTKKMYLELPSSVNPSLSQDKLQEIEIKLRKRGDEKIWLREYMGQLIFGGEGAIFPDFNKDLIYSKNYLTTLIQRDKKKLQWYAVFDPGTTTCFAVLFIAYNPHTSQVFILDEIYEKERRNTSSTQIWTRAETIRKELFDYEDKWTNLYDEAAAWFANEVLDSFNVGLIPTRKQRVAREHSEGRPGESLIKDIMTSKKLFIADTCRNFIWELENYVTDEAGKYPIKDDHLIDCFHYFVLNSYYELNEVVDKEETERTKYNKNHRYTSINAELEKVRKNKDFTSSIDVDYYDSDLGDIWLN